MCWAEGCSTSSSQALGCEIPWPLCSDDLDKGDCWAFKATSLQPILAVTFYKHFTVIPQHVDKAARLGHSASTLPVLCWTIE